MACVAVYISGWNPDLERLAWPLAAVVSIFVAGGFVELVANTLAIWLFAKSIEDRVGGLRLLAVFLLAGIAGAAARDLLLTGAEVPVPGAAGAVAGLIGAYLALFWRARFLCFVVVPFFVTMIEVPVVVIAAIWLALQAFAPFGQPAVAELAGGAVLGVAAIRLAARRRPAAGAEPSQPVY